MQGRLYLTIALFLLCTLCGALCGQEQVNTPPRNIGAGKPSPRSESAPKDPYLLRISGYYEDGNNTFIQLNNGTVWRHKQPNLFRQGWLVGDEIELSGRVEKDWIMKNNTYKGTAPVSFEKGIGDAMPTIVRNDNSGGVLTLDDGSVWRIVGWNRFWSGAFTWQRGDRIIISPLNLPVGSDTHLLINIDREMEDADAIILQR